VVAHTDLQVFNQMPHRSPGLLNPRVESLSGPSYSKFKVSFDETYRIIFDPKSMEAPPGGKGAASEKPVRLLHR